MLALIKVPARALQRGDVTGSGETVVSVSAGVRTPRGKIGSSFVSTPDYWHIRGYLNLHELMAVGVKNDVFDDHVCFNFWARELGDAYKRTKPLIEHIQTKETDEHDTYTELVGLAVRWSEMEPHPPA